MKGRRVEDAITRRSWIAKWSGIARSGIACWGGTKIRGQLGRLRRDEDKGTYFFFFATKWTWTSVSSALWT